MIFQLRQDVPVFPDPRDAEDDGLLAIGGDLSSERLLVAYSNGIFPWFDEQSPILWYAPHERFVIFPEDIHISKSLRQTMRKGAFKVTMNQDFGRVIRNCSTIPRKDQDGTWITNDMIMAYEILHKMGHAHSIEVWKDDQLVGGLYGVLVNKVFCGESMFSFQADASKLALVHLARHTDISLIDCQFHTPHLAKMGGKFITFEDYYSILRQSSNDPTL